MNIPNVRPGALSGTMQPFDAEPLVDETVETATQPSAGAGGADDTESYDLDLSGEQTSDGTPLPPAQTVETTGIETTATVGAEAAAESPVDDSAAGDPQTTSAAGSDADGPPSGDDSTSDTGQNSTSSPDAGSGSD